MKSQCACRPNFSFFLFFFPNLSKLWVCAMLLKQLSFVAHQLVDNKHCYHSTLMVEGVNDGDSLDALHVCTKCR